MTDKEMEGDNPRRRKLAREARALARKPSQARVTLGASKQHEYVTRERRTGPPPAGARKPVPGATQIPQRAPAERQWPRAEPATVAYPVPRIRYRDLVSAVGLRTGLDFDSARVAAEATVTALARALDDANRERLLRAVPTELHDDFALVVPEPPRDLSSFLREVSRMADRPPEQARYQAQAVLVALAEQNAPLLEELDLPPAVRELTAPPPVGGGLVGPAGHSAPLTDDELREALHDLPHWSLTEYGLCRTITLPRENLERVLKQLGTLKRNLGRGPHVGREDDQSAALVVRTDQARAVTALDVELAHRVDEAIEEAGAGMAAG